jgi:uncharacterized membrane protein
MSVDILGTLHVLSAGAALALGTAVAAAPKGTAWHRLVGRSYTAAMLVLNGSALTIYDLSGGPNPFHFLAIVSLVSIAMGWRAARLRFSGWRAPHAQWMLWSYVGLLAAAASELVVRLPGGLASWRVFGLLVGLASVVVCAAGAFVIRRTVARISGPVVRTEGASG